MVRFHTLIPMPDCTLILHLLTQVSEVSSYMTVFISKHSKLRYKNIFIKKNLYACIQAILCGYTMCPTRVMDNSI